MMPSLSVKYWSGGELGEEAKKNDWVRYQAVKNYVGIPISKNTNSIQAVTKA